MTLVRALAVASLCSALAACDAGSGGKPVGSAGPTLSIAAPRMDQTFDGDQVELMLDLKRRVYAGVEAAGSLDQQAICDALHANGADTTFNGHLTFDPAANNFWPTTQGIKQIQDGDWVMVWPEERAAAPLRGPAS